MTQPPQPDKKLEDEVTYGIDEGAPNGDKSALTIRKGKEVFTYVGEEAEALIALLRSQRQAVIDEGYIKKLDLKCYNCGNFTVQIYDRARCPFCGCDAAIKKLRGKS